MLLSDLAHSMAHDFRMTGNLILTEMRYFLIVHKITFQTPNTIIFYNVIILSEGDVVRCRHLRGLWYVLIYLGSL
jgi:hypothetical protein